MCLVQVYHRAYGMYPAVEIVLRQSIVPVEVYVVGGLVLSLQERDWEILRRLTRSAHSCLITFGSLRNLLVVSTGTVATANYSRTFTMNFHFPK
jgi:hypothetical protein